MPTSDSSQSADEGLAGLKREPDWRRPTGSGPGGLTPQPPPAVTFAADIGSRHSSQISEAPAVERYQPGMEAEIVRVLNAAFQEGWGNEADWRWKHSFRPGFVPEDVLVAWIGDEIVGCFHSAIRSLTIDEGLDVPMCFDGDLAVRPGFRGRGVSIAFRDWSEGRSFASRVALRGGFTSAELNEHLYEPHFDFIFLPAVTIQFRKYLGLGPLSPRVERLGKRLLARERLRRALARGPFVVGLRIDGVREAHLTLSAEGFRLDSAPAQRWDLAVTAPYGSLASLADGPMPFAKALLSAVLGGRVRVAGLLRSAPRLIRLVGAVLWGR